MNAEKLPVAHNVGHEEITKFEAVASHWWDLEGKFKPLYHINPLRLGYITEHLDDLFGKKVLDVGCSGGTLVESIVYEDVTAIELDMGFKPLQVTKLHALESGIQAEHVQETVEEHTEKHTHWCDVVACMGMLEHVPDLQSVVRACSRLVKPSGEVFFSMLDRNGRPRLMVVVGAEYILRIVPRGTHDVKKFIKPAELSEWVDQTVLKEHHITSLRYSPIADTFKLGSGVDVSYMVHTAARVD